MKITTTSVLIVICLVCAGPLAKIKAVSPPSDGDYPGGNTAEGQEALFGLTSAGYNTAVGWLSLATVSTGDLNTGAGAGTLLFNTEMETSPLVPQRFSATPAALATLQMGRSSRLTTP
jgi:hypothetical protein